MTMKYLQKKIELCSNGNIVDLALPIELEYYLLESSDIDYIEELNGKKVYGIEIVKREISSGDHSNIESKVVKNLSCCKEDTACIISKLASNSVTPIGLPFVLDDLIGA